MRFRVTTDASGEADGWWLDDITMSDAPAPVGLLSLNDITSDQIRINWVANTNWLFSHYAVVRGNTSGTDINSYHVANISNQAVTTYLDQGLFIDTLYYYRVFAVSRYGAYSAAGDELSARTLNNPVPFTEDFESALSRWIFTGAWAATTNAAHDGTFSLTDSPSGTYTNNSDSWARTAVNLMGTTWPVLRFWDRYDIANPDWGWVEVSTDGANWYRLYGVNGTQTDWREKRIDLSPWRTSSNLLLRFRLATDSSTTADGWYIDAVRVEELGSAGASLPVLEWFEDGATNWLNGSWRVTTNTAQEGTFSIVDTEGFTFSPDTYVWLTYGKPLNLAGTTNPVLTFWMQGNLLYRTYLRVQMSSEGGLNWTDLLGYNYTTSWTNWTRFQVDVPAGMRVNGARLRVMTLSQSGTQPNQNIYLDKLTIEEMPQPVALQTLTPSLKSMEISWTEPVFPGFKSNVLMRATSPNVWLLSTVVMGFSDPTITNWTDTRLSIGTRYYYRMF